MRKYKKFLKRAGLILMIILALVGISISGGVPVNTGNKRRERDEVWLELVELDEEGEDADEKD